MPSLAGASQKTKGKKKARKKPPKTIPDPDAAYRQYLDETLYIPKTVRKKAVDNYLAAVDNAIKANIIDLKLPLQDDQLTGPISFAKVLSIFQSLGLCLTDDQFDQISAMIAQNDQHPPSQGSGLSANLKEAELVGDYADREKLRNVAVELLHTHVLAYDPQVLARPHPRFPNRVSSVVYRSTEGNIRACFNALWEASGGNKLISADGTSIRCVSVDELEVLMAREESKDPAKGTLSSEELEELYFFAKDTNESLLREDLFLKCLVHVK